MVQEGGQSRRQARSRPTSFGWTAPAGSSASAPPHSLVERARVEQLPFPPEQRPHEFAQLALEEQAATTLAAATPGAAEPATSQRVDRSDPSSRLERRQGQRTRARPNPARVHAPTQQLATGPVRRAPVLRAASTSRRLRPPPVLERSARLDGRRSPSAPPPPSTTATQLFARATGPGEDAAPSTSERSQRARSRRRSRRRREEGREGTRPAEEGERRSRRQRLYHHVNLPSPTCLDRHTLARSTSTCYTRTLFLSNAVHTLDRLLFVTFPSRTFSILPLSTASSSIALFDPPRHPLHVHGLSSRFPTRISCVCKKSTSFRSRILLESIPTVTIDESALVAILLKRQARRNESCLPSDERNITLQAATLSHRRRRHPSLPSSSSVACPSLPLCLLPRRCLPCPSSMAPPSSRPEPCRLARTPRRVLAGAADPSPLPRCAPASTFVGSRSLRPSA